MALSDLVREADAAVGGAIIVESALSLVVITLGTFFGTAMVENLVEATLGASTKMNPAISTFGSGCFLLALFTALKLHTFLSMGQALSDLYADIRYA